jgi:glycosyltransferase involved in cell wall biosynthesis
VVHRSFGLYRDTLDCLVTPSRFYRSKLVEWGWDAQRIAYIPNFIDAEQFTPWCHEGNYFVYAGRLAPEKGLATLVRAAALSKQRVVLVGSGPEEAALRQLASELEADVVFAGYMEKPALKQLIGESRALVLPSEWYENAPVSVLEAYALGRPVIGTRIGGIPELIVHNKTGVLVEPGDVGMLAEALAGVAELPRNTRTRLGAAGRNWVRREFSPEQYRDRTIELYNRVAH